MPLSLVYPDSPDAPDPAEHLVLADLANAAGLASVGRIAGRIGLSQIRVESVLEGLVRRGLVRTCRWADGVYFELIPEKE